ncbi:MAG TPA: type IV pilus assembly protein PilM [Candidatus Acidoferrum sp.]|nr:type IV pilus assembly protein PilM [Candidatus Acidoferrum sp.]
MMMMSRFARKPRETFGLDIGTSAVKVVQLREGPGGFVLIALGSAPLPLDAIGDGTIKAPDAVAAAIRDAVARAGIKTREAVIGIAGRELITKKVQLPEVPAKELRDAVELEAEHHIPFAFDEVCLDYHVAGRHGGMMDLVLVAVKKSKVNEYVAVVEDAGFAPVIVDVDGFAVGNQFELNHPEPSGDSVALIDMGAAVMKTNVVRGGAPAFARDIPFGGNQYTQAIADRLHTTFEHAERAKLGEAADIPWDSIVPALESVSRDLALEVRRTFDYFGSTSDSERIGRVVMSGGAARLRGLTEYLSSTWSIPVEVARPFERIDVDAAHEDEVRAAGPSLTVAVGLALRRPGERRG